MSRLRSVVVAAAPQLVVLVVVVFVWWAAVRILEPKPFIFPSPGRVWSTTVTDADRLWIGFKNTLYASVVGFFFATAVGVGSALVLSMSRVLERAFFRGRCCCRPSRRWRWRRCTCCGSARGASR